MGDIRISDIGNPVSFAPVPSQCPSRARRAAAGAPHSSRRWVNRADLHREPFRLFFPAATVAGLVGVALWPMLLLGWTESYPGPSHARLMIQGFFGGYILGFLGTAMPRLIGASAFSAWETYSLLSLFAVNVALNVAGMNFLADCFFIAELACLFGLVKRRCQAGMELPPPSFVLVGMAFAAGLAGTGLRLVGRIRELSPELETLARLLGYHAFVLLAVLGAGGFLLPRFLGLGTRRKYSEGTGRKPVWNRAAQIASSAGLIVLLTYIVEGFGWNRTSGIIRAIVIVAYLAYETPLERLRWSWRGVHWLLIVGLVCIPVGILAAALFPASRATLLHLELVGGFALITLGVATRVVFGHSGVGSRLERFQPWLTTAAVLTLIGMSSRISGDFLPGIQATHYMYGALCWIAGAIIWSWCVLPRVLRPDSE